MVTQEIEDNPRDRVISLLKDLFQFDLADLDFGIYRIMNFKRKEIEHFIEKDLVGRVEEELSSLARQSMDRQRKELEDLAAEANRTLGEGTIDKDGEIRGFEEAAIVREYIEKRKGLSKTESNRADAVTIYNHIYEFFSRYYDQGDFLSKRRIGGREKYVVPYSGEEVFLHWANRDQHYAKTGEYFSNYDFKAGKWSVHFTLVRAEVSQDNIKGNNRYFILSTDKLPEIDPKNNELRVFFNYRELTEPETKNLGKKVTQDSLAASAASAIQKAVEGSELASLLSAKKPGDERSLVEVHINRYVKKNTTDYFIHKDLGGFLRRELEYFIQGEVLRTRELAECDPATIQKTVNRAKTFQKVSETIIDFLAQIENFQRLLFEKKKLVLKTDYLVPIRKVPRGLWPQVLSCKKQVAEWADLYSLEPKRDLLNPKGDMNEHVLDKYPNLVVDTRHFDPTFKGALLESFDNIDEACGGILIHAENFQALSLINATYRGRVSCIYIDPPYNTFATKILYKNEYEHSSWLTLLEDRILSANLLLGDSAITCITIDDYEHHRLVAVLNRVYGDDNHLATVVVKNNPSGRSTVKGFSINHEYGLFYSKSAESAEIGRMPHTETQRKRYEETDEEGRLFEWENFRKSSEESLRQDRPKQYYPIFYDRTKGSLRIPRLAWQDQIGRYKILDELSNDEITIWPRDEAGKERVWRYGVDRASSIASTMKVRKVGTRFEIYTRKYLQAQGTLPRTWWDKPEYSARDNGTRVLADFFGRKIERPFDFPKAPAAVRDSIRVCNPGPEGIVLDYFAGSGTTAQAVIELNREDGARRKFILVEVGDYFETVILPRVKKVMFSPEWKEGTPVRQPTQAELDSSPALVKHFKLESYEDTLNNIVFKERDKSVQETLDSLGGYFIRYMLEYETRGSKTRFSVKDFEDPFAYKIRSDGRGDAGMTPVDLVETFNLLLGLRVKKVRHARSGTRPYSCVVGNTPDGGQAVIVWRPTKDIDYAVDRDFIQDNFLKDLKGTYTLYANGICNVKGAKSIEPVFKELMGG